MSSPDHQPHAEYFAGFPAFILSSEGPSDLVTIGIDGHWFEVKREEQAQPPRPYVYVLRPAPPGKILRGYQQDPAATLETVAMQTPDADLS